MTELRSWLLTSERPERLVFGVLCLFISRRASIRVNVRANFAAPRRASRDLKPGHSENNARKTTASSRARAAAEKS